MMSERLLSRRELIRLAGIGGLSVITGMATSQMRLTAGDADPAPAPGPVSRAFYFLQMSDTHIGFTGTTVNPDPGGTLAKAVAAVNALAHPPEFIVFTGDLIHKTEDATVRRARMQAFKDIIAVLTVTTLYFLPGEHDAASDQGVAYQEFFGPMHYVFDRHGVHFIVLDNVSSSDATIGTAQLAWLKADLARVAHDTPIVVLTHRPLFALFPQWDWNTVDAAAAIDLLMPFSCVTVFYGHIHQVHHFMTGHIAHHAAHGLMYALPAPGSVAAKKPIPWDPQKPYANLGFRELTADEPRRSISAVEFPVRNA